MATVCLAMLGILSDHATHLYEAEEGDRKDHPYIQRTCSE